VPPAPVAKVTAPKPKALDERTESTKLAEAVRDLTTTTLASLAGKDAFAEMCARQI
jgi:hypothetical protein